MKTIFVLLLSVSIVSCTAKRELSQDKEPFMVCSCQQDEKRAGWVGQHVKDSNNMSDEEMEDVISELNRVSYGMFCSEKLFYYTGDGYSMRPDYTRIKLDSCERIVQ